MTNYNIHQQTFILSQASNILSTCRGSQKHLQEKITKALQPTIDQTGLSDWQVAWGPSVWKFLPHDILFGPSHTWFAAHIPAATFNDGTYDAYVVAVAGTADHSIINLIEDLNVTQVVDFNAWASTGFSEKPVKAQNIKKNIAYISKGTADGVYVLLNTKGPDGTTLSQFLSSIPSTSRIVFTGHSLAGALTPTLALAVSKAGIARVPAANILSYATAGPSPGNKPFADLFAASFPSISTGTSAYEVWNVNVWNQYDIVPHAWSIRTDSEQTLTVIPLIYGFIPLEVFKKVTKIVGVAIGASVLSHVSYAPIRGSKIVPEKPSTPDSIEGFLRNVGEQHVRAYREFFGVPEVPPLCAKLTEAEMLSTLPVLNTMKYLEELESDSVDSEDQ